MPDRSDTGVVVREPRTDGEWAAYFELRWRVLRAPWGQPRGSERDDLDEVAWHRIAVDTDRRVIGVGRLQRLDALTGQIRYMAIDPVSERKGIGSQILQALESAARHEGLRVVRLNAREGAVPFYAHHDYRMLEPSHVLFGEIRHVLMEKTL